jgi:hypothetical protein
MVVPDMRGSDVHRLTQTAVLAVAGLAIAASVTGCGTSGPVYVESTTRYTDTSVDALFESAHQSELVGRPASDSSALRQHALAALRSEGDRGSAAADLITETFPADTRGVPAYVEWAEFEGTPSLLLMELTGPPGDPLDDVRLWVIDESGNVLYSEVR